jgi:hypothetical protein
MYDVVEILTIKNLSASITVHRTTDNACIFPGYGHCTGSALKANDNAGSVFMPFRVLVNVYGKFPFEVHHSQYQIEEYRRKYDHTND